MAENLEQTRKSYDLVAEEYVRRLYHELESMPLDCEVLERFATAVRHQGLVGDLGCGPGQVARYLHERGVAVVGLDLSPRMVELARQLNHDIEFQQGDMVKLPAQDMSWAPGAGEPCSTRRSRRSIATCCSLPRTCHVGAGRGVVGREGNLRPGSSTRRGTRLASSPHPAEPVR